MSKNKFVTVVLVIILGGLVLIIVNAFGKKEIAGLVGSNFQQIVKSKPVQSSSPVSETPAYNPPKAINYGPGTDLQGELDSVDPEILDSDFKNLQDLTGGLKSP